MKTKANIPEEELKQVIENIEKEKGYKICGYPWYDKNGNLHVCKNPASVKTHHPGVGRCYLHGGKGGVVRTGEYSKYKEENPLVFWRLVAEYESKSNWDTLEQELAILRVLRDDIINNIHEREFKIPALIKTIEAIATLVEKQAKLEEKNLFTISDIRDLMARIVEIIDRLVEDVDLKVKILNELKNVVITISKIKKAGGF